MNKKGFTLIELLVVISIIGILASLTLVSYTGAQKQGRDTQRKSDLGQYRNALETYATSNSSLYPGGLTSINGLCTVISPIYIASCPNDPLGGSLTYGFYSSGSAGGSGSDYIIYAQLETGGYWEICSNGKSGKLSSAPTPWDSNCDL